MSKPIPEWEAGHTPGPWEAAECGGWLVLAGPLTQNKPGHVIGGRGHVARVDDDDFTEDEQEANAHLLAAAPDMARALLRILGAGVCSNTGRTKVGCDEIQATPCQACEARAALRKGGVIP